MENVQVCRERKPTLMWRGGNVELHSLAHGVGLWEGPKVHVEPARASVSQVGTLPEPEPNPSARNAGFRWFARLTPAT